MKNKTALITGSGTRLGMEFARHLSKRGYDLILHYNTSAQSAQELLSQIREMGNDGYLIQADFSNPTAIDGFINNCNSLIDQTLLDLEIVIHSAAIMPSQHIGKISSEEFDKVISVNFKAPFLISQALIPKMTGKASVINISDVASDLVWTKYPAYCLSKNALTQSTKFFAKEFAPLVRINSLSLGLVQKETKTSSEVWESLISKVPLQRKSQVSEILAGIDFLIDNEYYTGQNLVIDGGRSLRS